MNKVIPAIRKNPNPQGKGCVPVLQDWTVFRPTVIRHKSADDVLIDYCLSALVLAAKFRFKPVPNKPYYLYSRECGWSLSLIAPEQWGEAIPGLFVASCRLINDMTWRLDFDDFLVDSPVPERLERFIEGFVDTLSGQASVVDQLPFYVGELPYYQRMLATGLAVSLKYSIEEIGDHSIAEALPKLLSSQSC